MSSRTNFGKELNIFLIIFLGLALAGYFAWNYLAFFENIRYKYFATPPTDERLFILERDEIQPEPRYASFPVEEFAQAVLPPVSPSKIIQPAKTSQHRSTLVIPKISVETPIAFAKDESTKAILKSLEEGVGMYPGSDMPGEPGRAVLLGHSSRASWYNGEYAYIFSLLAKLDVLDEFYVIEKAEDGTTQKYTYTVFAKQFLSPDETNAVLAGPSAPTEMDLITCWPIGSASQRTLIRGSLTKTEILQ